MKNVLIKIGILFFSASISGNVAAQTITTIAGGGTGYLYNIPATSFNLLHPKGLFTDDLGNLYVTDQQAVYKINLQSNILSYVVGNLGIGFSGDGQPANTVGVRIDNPMDVLADNLGNIFFTDYNNSRIRRIDGVTDVITTYAGGGNTLGPLGGSTVNLADTKFSYPTILNYDSSGNILVGDTTGQQIKKIVTSTSLLHTIAGTGFIGGMPDGNPALGFPLNYPGGAVADTAGNIYFCNTGNHQIKKIDAVTKVVTTVAGISNQPGYTGDGGLAVNAKLNSPYSILIDDEGNLIFSDWLNNRIRKINLTTGIINTIAGNGAAEFSGDNGPAISAGLNRPMDIALKNGILYIADSQNKRIRKMALAYLSTSETSVIPFKIKENPVNDRLDISNGNSEKIIIYDLSGKIVFSGKLEKGQTNVRLLEKGIYILRIKGNSIKFVKN